MDAECSLVFSHYLRMECFARGIFQSSFLLKPNFVMSTYFGVRELGGVNSSWTGYVLLRCTRSVAVSLARWTLHRCAQGHGTLHPKSGSFNDTLPERHFFAASVHPLDRFSLEQTLEKLQHCYYFSKKKPKATEKVLSKFLTGAKVESESAEKLFCSQPVVIPNIQFQGTFFQFLMSNIIENESTIPNGVRCPTANACLVFGRFTLFGHQGSKKNNYIGITDQPFPFPTSLSDSHPLHSASMFPLGLAGMRPLASLTITCRAPLDFLVLLVGEDSPGMYLSATIMSPR